jgi:hypothetical protein
VLAQDVVVRQVGDACSLSIDGQEFPWLITEAGVHTESLVDGTPTVTVSIIVGKSLKTLTR